MRIDYNSKGNLDDVSIENVKLFRLEYMGEGNIWIRLYMESGGDHVFSLAANGPIIGAYRHEPVRPAGTT